MWILKDRISPLDPSSLPRFLESDQEAEAEGGSPEPLVHQPFGTSREPERVALPEDVRPHLPVGKTSFELASRSGFVRTVTGTVASLDEEAQTYMVSRGNGDGELFRVPLRDITSAHETVTGHQGLDRDAEGLGTRQ